MVQPSNDRLRGLVLPMKSMTGFGRAAVATDEFSLTVELRTVNNRFLDIQIRLPSELAAMEVSFRKLVQSRVQRGRVEATVGLVQQRPIKFHVNLPLVQGYVAALREAQAATGVAGDFDLSLIARLPGAIQPALALDEALIARLAEGLLDAAGQVRRSRRHAPRRRRGIGARHRRSARRRRRAHSCD